MPCSGLLNTHLRRLRASVILSHHVPPCCEQLWKRWKSVGFANIPQGGVKRPWLGSGAGSGENVSYLWFDFCHRLLASLEAFQPQQLSVYWMRNGLQLVSKKSLSLRILLRFWQRYKSRAFQPPVSVFKVEQRFYSRSGTEQNVI